MTQRSAILILIICASLFLTAQMPGWKHYRDREGNSWFIDTNGKLYFDADAAFITKPVSPLNIDYSLGQAGEFLRAGKKTGSLTIWKSILCLSPVNTRIVRARELSAAAVTGMRKREGDRFTGIDREASVMVYAEKDTTTIYSDLMRYSITVNGGAELVRRNSRYVENYLYNGITAGILPTGTKSGGPYSFIIAVSSEKFKSKVKGMDEALTHWRTITGHDGFQRTAVKENEALTLYEFTSEKNEYLGFEAVTVNGHILCVFRFIAPAASYADVRERMLAAVNSIKIVSQ
jgi:hypothetical protein